MENSKTMPFYAPQHLADEPVLELFHVSTTVKLIALLQNTPLCSTFPMLVPSLSWSNDRF